MSTSIIMIGVPGAGKTRWVRNNAETYRYCSADSLRMVNGVYVYDPNREKNVHSECLRQFAVDVVNGLDTVCDNTNTTLMQIAPYVALGMAFSDTCRVVYVRGPGPQECFHRNTHGVPLDAVVKKYCEIGQMLENWPSHWPKVEEV